MLALATSPPAPSPVTLAEAREWLGLSTPADDALVARLLGAATAVAEGFLRCALIDRPVVERLPAAGGWRVLGQEPVSAITGMVALDATPSGIGRALSPTDWAMDIDAGGRGHVRVLDAGRARVVEVAYRAGLASGPDGVPEAVRHGILTLAADRHRARDAGVEAPALSPAVRALWHPFRRLSVGGPRDLERARERVW